MTTATKKAKQEKLEEAESELYQAMGELNEVLDNYSIGHLDRETWGLKYTLHIKEGLEQEQSSIIEAFVSELNQLTPQARNKVLRAYDKVELRNYTVDNIEDFLD